jgi:hypothetical protein
MLEILAITYERKLIDRHLNGFAGLSWTLRSVFLLLYCRNSTTAIPSELIQCSFMVLKHISPGNLFSNTWR